MKKCLFIALALCVGISSYAQKKLPIIKENLKKQSAVRTNLNSVDMPKTPNTKINPYVAPRKTSAASKSVNTTEDIIGTTKYDLQSNMSVQNRIYAYPDGSVAGTFTYGQSSPSFSDRGTGYNYNDGSAWDANPTARVEAARCGWPSYCPLGAGELIVTHNGTTGLIVSKRTTKGTGTWNQTLLTGPVNSGGTTALLWPRTVTQGDTIHIIATTDQAVSPDVYYYQGLALALVYIRSVDGGSTWDAPIILPGMDSASSVSLNHKGYGGDSYAWANPAGNTIAFAVGDDWGGLFIMKSTDRGDNWTKIPIFDFPTFTTGPTGMVPTVDGSVAIALDGSGDAHVCAGRMRVSDSIFTDEGSFWYPYTDGLIYWREGMPVLDTAQISNSDTLAANGNLIGYMMDWDQSDTIDFPIVTSGYPFGLYYLSLSSMPQILCNGNDVYVTYSSCMENFMSTGATPNTQLYRHIIFTKSNDGGTTWDVGTDLNSNPIHDYDECVFASLAPTMPNGQLHLIYQGDEEPGLSVRGDEDPAYSTNNIFYLTFPTNVGVNESIQAINNVNVYPNPANDYSYIDITINQTQNVDIYVSNMLGQQVYNHSYGKLSAGKHTFSVEAGKFLPGVYFYTIKTNNSSVSRKMIVE